MKYYCKNCGSTVELGKDAFMQYSFAMLCNGKVCPICNCHGTEEIPEYETPEQYEKRTGQPWPDNAPVWYWNYMMEMWLVDEYTCARVFRKSNVCSDLCHIVCVQSPVPPPDGWKPEDEADASD